MGRTEIRELGPETWEAFARVVEKHRGIWGGCWCFAFHVGPKDRGRTPERNRSDKEEYVRSGRSHAALVCEGDDVIGWCQYGPPAELPARMASYVRLKVDHPEWRITCFFVDRDHRGEGVASRALSAALRGIAQRGGGSVDAYPTTERSKHMPGSFLWSGTASMFAKYGFRAVGRLGPKKRIVRKFVRAARSVRTASESRR